MPCSSKLWEIVIPSQGESKKIFFLDWISTEKPLVFSISNQALLLKYLVIFV